MLGTSPDCQNGGLSLHATEATRFKQYKLEETPQTRNEQTRPDRTWPRPAFALNEQEI